jgi:hypothetical protein
MAKLKAQLAAECRFLLSDGINEEANRAMIRAATHRCLSARGFELAAMVPGFGRCAIEVYLWPDDACDYAYALVLSATGEIQSCHCADTAEFRAAYPEMREVKNTLSMHACPSTKTLRRLALQRAENAARCRAERRAEEMISRYLANREQAHNCAKEQS